MRLNSSLFNTTLIVEFLVLIVHFSIETKKFKVFVLILTFINGLAFGSFHGGGFTAEYAKKELRPNEPA